MPNILDLLGNVNRSRSIYQVRQERIKREGSPYFTWNFPATAATANSSIYVPDQFPASRKYEPLDWIEVANNEAANNLRLIINGGDSFPVPAKTIRTISGKALWHIQIINDGGAITTLGLVVVTMRREPFTIDKWSRKQ